MAKGVYSECNDVIVGCCSYSAIFWTVISPPNHIATDCARKGVFRFQCLGDLASKIGRIVFKFPP